MSKMVYKYVLEATETQTITVPSTRILSVMAQQDNIVVFAVVEPDSTEQHTFEFGVVGTGHLISFDSVNFEFLGTVSLQDEGADLVFHVFYREVIFKGESL